MFSDESFPLIKNGRRLHNGSYNALSDACRTELNSVFGYSRFSCSGPSKQIWCLNIIRCFTLFPRKGKGRKDPRGNFEIVNFICFIFWGISGTPPPPFFKIMFTRKLPPSLYIPIYNIKNVPILLKERNGNKFL